MPESNCLEVEMMECGPDFPCEFYLEYYPDEDEISELIIQQPEPTPAPPSLRLCETTAQRCSAAPRPPATPPRYKTPLRLIRGSASPDPAPGAPNLHLVPLLNDSCARVIFHLGARFIEQAIARNCTDHTLRKLDIEKVIDRLCQVTT
jgi:hypothetical protein